MKKILYSLVLVFIISSFWSFAFAGEGEDYSAIKQSFSDNFYSLTLNGCNAFLKKYPNSDFKEDISLIKGLALFYLKEYSQAVVIFEAILDSKDVRIRQEAIFYLGKLYALSMEHDKAVKLLTQLFELDEDIALSGLAGHELGLIYFNKRDYSKAVEYWEEVLKRLVIPEDIKAELVHNLVQAYIKTEDLDKAKTAIEDSIDRNTAEYHFLKGKVGYLSKEYLSSLDKFDQIVQSDFSPFWTQKAELSKVWIYIDTERYREAEEIIFSLEDVILKDLEDELFYLKPFIFYKKSEFSPAIRNYQRFIYKYKDSDWHQRAFLELVDCYYNINKLLQAEKMALQFLAKELSSGSTDRMRHMLGWVYYKKGDLEKAVLEFEAVANNSKDIDLKINSLCRVGDLLAEMGRVEEAMDKYNLILKEYSDSLYAEYAQYQLGIYLFQQGDYAGAILAFRVAIENFPKSLLLDKVHFYLAGAYFKQGDYEMALTEVETFLSSQSEEDFKKRASIQKAALLYNLGNYREAEEFIKSSEMLALDPYAHFVLAKIYLKDKRFQDADREYDWLKENLDDPDMLAYFYFYRAELDFYLKEWDRACANFQNAYQIAKKDHLKEQSLYWQGWCHYNKNDLKKAFDMFDILKDSKTLSQEARYNIALIFNAQGRAEQAIKILEVIVSQKERFSRLAALKLGDIYKERNDRQRALEQYRSLEVSPYDIIAAEASFNIGEIYEVENKVEEAILQYLSLSALYNVDLSFVNKARVRCARLLEKEARYEEAEKIYREIALTSSEEAIYAKARLKKIEELK
ncbi:MAG: tetratricopeptide repeat protein [Candidatus Kaelpia aquatica]|nr:tetratricopeptide repeat protein [Candidatus Kaelpia aquatica]